MYHAFVDGISVDSLPLNIHGFGHFFPESKTSIYRKRKQKK